MTTRDLDLDGRLLVLKRTEGLALELLNATQTCTARWVCWPYDSLGFRPQEWTAVHSGFDRVPRTSPAQ